MARGRHTAQAADAPPPSLSEFDAEAGLLALQKHVDATSQLAVTNLHATNTRSAVPSSRTAVALHNIFAPPTVELEAQIHPDLRTAQQLGLHPGSDYPPVPEVHMSAVSPQSVPASVPVGAVASMPMQTDGPPSADGRRGPRRELSQSKRAAQNRAAQRAFRQRKEGYIKKLEAQVSDYNTIDAQLKLLQAENYSLREYIIHLQSKLLDAKAELPPAPANLNLSAPGAGAVAAANALANAAAATLANQVPLAHEQVLQEQKTDPVLSSNDPLARVAQAVAELRGMRTGGEASEFVKPEDHKEAKSSDDGMSPGDEIDRQLQTAQEAFAAPVAQV